MGSKRKKRKAKTAKAKAAAEAEEATKAKEAAERAEAEARAEEDDPSSASADADSASEDEAPAEKNGGSSGDSGSGDDDEGSSGSDSGSEDDDEEADRAAAEKEEEDEGSDGSTASSEPPGEEEKDKEEEEAPPPKKRGKESKKKRGAHDDGAPSPGKKKTAAATAPESGSEDDDEDEDMGEAVAKDGEGSESDGSTASSKAPSEEDKDGEEAPPPKKRGKESKKRKADESNDGGASSPGKKAAPATDDDRRIFVRGLPFKATKQQVRDFFADGGAPAPADVELPLDKGGRPSGNAVLTFPSSDASDAALALDGKAFGDSGRYVRVSRPGRTNKGPSPKPEGCTRIFLGKLPKGVDESTLRGLFAECGTVRGIEIPRRSRGFIHVSFEETEATDKAVALSGTKVMGRPIWVDYATGRDHTKEKKDDKGREGQADKLEPGEKPEGCKKVFVGNIPFKVNNEDAVRKAFEGCGEVRAVRLIRALGTEKARHAGMAFVQFAEAEAADNAVEMAGTAEAEMDGRALRIDYAVDDKSEARWRREQRKRRESAEEPRRKSGGCKKVFVSNLPFKADGDAVRKALEGCGEIRAVHLRGTTSSGGKEGENSGIGFVEFAKAEAADKAVVTLGDGGTAKAEIDGRALRVEYAKEELVGGGGKEGGRKKRRGGRRKRKGGGAADQPAAKKRKQGTKKQ